MVYVLLEWFAPQLESAFVPAGVTSDIFNEHKDTFTTEIMSKVCNPISTYEYVYVYR
jgi:hypothetical protein